MFNQILGYILLHNTCFFSYGSHCSFNLNMEIIMFKNSIDMVKIF